MRRFLGILVVLLLVAGAVGYFLLRSQSRSAIQALEAQMDQAVASQKEKDAGIARDLALDLTRTLAVTMASTVARGDADTLNSELAAVVKGKRVAGVIVVDPTGTVLASTDLRYRGRTLDDSATQHALEISEVSLAAGPPAPAQVEVDAPVFVGSQKVGALRVFVDLGELAGS